MQGLPIEEKMMLLRMGELIDGAINNRTPTNPFALRGHRKNRIVRASNLESDISARGAVLRWEKVNSSDLLHYKIRILPQDGADGEEVDATSYTNQFLFKGRAGSYKYNVAVVNRNGQSSEWSSDHFFDIQDTPMILEGNKLGVEEQGARLFETVLCPLNYTVFAFASVILNTLADPNDNPSVTLKLSRGPEYDSSVFIQEFTLYPESEDLCNADATLGITRPAGTPARTGNFETTQSVMFTPYQILEETGIADTDVKFWIAATGHADDVVGMSCAIWVASEGLSEESGSAVQPATHLSSVQVPASGSTASTDRSFGFLEAGAEVVDNTLDNIYTFALWAKPTLDFTTGARILHLADFDASGGGFLFNNRRRLSIDWDETTANTLTIRQFDTDGTTSVTWTKNGQASVFPDGLNEWMFLVVAFNGTRSGSKFDVYINGVLISPTTDNSPATTIGPFNLVGDNRGISIGVAPVTSLFTTVTANVFSVSPWTARLHMAAFWDVVLSSAAVTSLYNTGNGGTNWRNSFGNYGNAADMRHYWRFGALDNDRDGSIGSITEWIKRGGGTPSQSEVNTNIANDVSFDLGNMQDVDDQFEAWDFTNRIFIDILVTSGSVINRETLGGSVLGSITVNAFPKAVDIVSDYPVNT